MASEQTQEQGNEESTPVVGFSQSEMGKLLVKLAKSERAGFKLAKCAPTKKSPIGTLGFRMAPGQSFGLTSAVLKQLRTNPMALASEGVNAGICTLVEKIGSDGQEAVYGQV